MIIYRPSPPSSERVRALRKSKFRAFKDRYPSPFYAWVERQPFWAALTDPYLLPELKVILTAGHEPVTSQDLWDCWYRAAVTMLVHPKRGREKGDFTEMELAAAFGINLGRYRNLVTKERVWLKRPTIKPLKIQRGLIAGQPDVEDLIIRLFK